LDADGLLFVSTRYWANEMDSKETSYSLLETILRFIVASSKSNFIEKRPAWFTEWLETPKPRDKYKGDKKDQLGYNPSGNNNNTTTTTTTSSSSKTTSSSSKEKSIKNLINISMVHLEDDSRNGLNGVQLLEKHVPFGDLPGDANQIGYGRVGYAYRKKKICLDMMP